ncbi:hypothetical protein [Bradyrhizobium sp. NAS96.2]|uniref:hypothetical protein n=1 Tax=Bradyrhizobium sp. NAS96.2 TaxID=1680160 RepID=UPI001160F8BB|nr:hypothetical protein [Bradyrhizobium sp. NAS96.2]
MATGRGMQLTRQIGEHLVAAELGRLGYIAAPFAGNVPLYDLFAADSRGHAIPIQVKAINGGSWQFNADAFLDIEVKNGEQVVKGTKKLLNPKLLCIFVLLVERGKDEFYLFHLSDLQKHCVKVYKPRGRSSKNPDSRHCAVSPKEFSRFKENWELLESALQQ